MGVYIKGMEMPKTCEDCQFHRYYSHYEYVCVATPLFYPMNLANSKGIRKDWCPLVEVPEPHGKLVEFIDVTTYEDDDSGTEEVNLGEAFAAYFKMREAKPVIEAEGTNEGSN